MKLKNFKKDMRAISPVIATLLMIAVAVVASLVAYAWVMGYIGGQTVKTGNAIQIQSVNQLGTIYVQNVGEGTVRLEGICLFINGAAVTTPSTVNGVDIAEGSTYELTGATAFEQGSQTYVIKVITTSGTFSEVQKNFPL